MFNLAFNTAQSLLHSKGKSASTQLKRLRRSPGKQRKRSAGRSAIGKNADSQTPRADYEGHQLMTNSRENV
jgi:hypothetical protein